MSGCYAISFTIIGPDSGHAAIAEVDTPGGSQTFNLADIVPSNVNAAVASLCNVVNFPATTNLAVFIDHSDDGVSLAFTGSGSIERIW